MNYIVFIYLYAFRQVEEIMNNIEILSLLTFIYQGKEKGHSLKYVLQQYADQKNIELSNAKNNYYIALNKYKSSQNLQDRLKLDVNYFDYTDFEYFTETEIKALMTYVMVNLASKSVRKCMYELANGDSKQALRLINKYRSVLLRKESLVYSIMLSLFRQGKAFVNPYTDKLNTPRISLVKLANLISPDIDDSQLKKLVIKLQEIEHSFDV